VLAACPICGTRVSTKWLLLGLPWSTYTCARCGSVLAGTLLRFVLSSLSVGVVSVVLLAVIKGRVSPAALAAPVVVALALLLLRLPWQIRSAK